MAVRSPAMASAPGQVPSGRVFPQAVGLGGHGPDGSFSQVEGPVQFGNAVQVYPGSILRAETDGAIHVGHQGVVQAGVVIHSLSAGRVLGDDAQSYGVWVGDRTVLTHKVVVQGPAYIGADCFIGFRSTIFNARIGEGCVVMMHTLIQDVAIPAGKYVPSGMVITSQVQAEQLPDVQPAQLAIAQDVMGRASAAAHVPQCSITQSASDSSTSDYSTTEPTREGNGFKTMQSQRLSPDIVQQVRTLLAQGLRIGTEHADVRRYRSGVWQTCSPIQSTREADVFSALEACLAEHAGEYVRLFGITPQKHRVATTTIQRGDGKPVEVAAGASVPVRPSSGGSGFASSGQRSGSRQGAGRLDPAVVQQVRSFLNQGMRIGTEHAGGRRYRSGVWQTCAPIQSTQEGQVLSALEACLADHAGEYVRMFGIDSHKHRVGTTTIQRGDGQPVEVTPMGAPSGGSSYSGSVPSGGLSQEAVNQVRSHLSQGHRIGAEHADSRRYRSGVWQSCPPIESTQLSQVVNTINQCMAANAGEYVRIYGIDPKAKRRVSAMTVQKPGQPSSGSASRSPGSAPRASQNGHSPSQNGHRNGSSSGPLSPDLVQQVNQLVNQGYRISTEFADSRRYRSGAWQTGPTLGGSRSSEVLSALESQLAAHSGEYVRLVGVDPRAKRRVLEATIQRP
jgi:carbon dioxide concentrating mechanism protein CcmM